MRARSDARVNRVTKLAIIFNLVVYIYIHIKQMRLAVYGKTKLFFADTKQYIQTLLIENMRSMGFIIPRTGFYCEPDINVISEF